MASFPGTRIPMGHDDDNCGDSFICKWYYAVLIAFSPAIICCFGLIIYKIHQKCNYCLKRRREANKSPEEKAQEAKEKEEKRIKEIEEYRNHLHVAAHCLPEGYPIPTNIQIEKL